MEARFFGEAFTPHRHDTYAIGVTLHGIQTFSYRGERRYSMPGNVIILYPDELHDGGAATDEGLRYRMLYLEPALLRQALPPGVSLPFIQDAVIGDAALRQIIMSVLADLETGLEELLVDQLIAELAVILSCRAGRSQICKTTLAPYAVGRARDYLHENLARAVSSPELETVTGLNRFDLARQFRRLYGTSPHRYHVMRRLDHARNLIDRDVPLADIAVATGFADQSHLNRQFKKAFGLTPGHWRALSHNRPLLHATSA